MDDEAVRNAVTAVQAYVTTGYPGWCNEAIALEPGGQEFLALRSDIRSLDVDCLDHERALQVLERANRIVATGYPGDEVTPRQLIETIGEHDAMLLLDASLALEIIRGETATTDARRS